MSISILWAFPSRWQSSSHKNIHALSDKYCYLRDLGQSNFNVKKMDLHANFSAGSLVLQTCLVLLAGVIGRFCVTLYRVRH